MSHFVCLVILPDGTTMEDAAAETERLLEPYCYSNNPEGRWDWWVIGGRWDGWILGPEHQKACHDNQHGFNFGSQHQQIANNCRPVEEIPLDDLNYVPFAMLNPDGGWHEIGRMCAFGIVANPMEEAEWPRQFREVMTKYAGHLAVTVDCHG